MEHTLSIIKPNGVKKGLIGEILSRFEKAGIKIAAMKMVHLTKEEAQGFYVVHKDRPFYDSLTTFMSSGPIVVSALTGENVISKNREIMGATDPAKAAKGTIRADFGESIEKNIAHGSDARETAKWEIDYFFKDEKKLEY